MIKSFGVFGVFGALGALGLSASDFCAVTFFLLDSGIWGLTRFRQKARQNHNDSINRHRIYETCYNTRYICQTTKQNQPKIFRSR
ncbi:hypothetical protein BA723_02645 [Helicobacter sp. CLO-3]|nr:hypothetical protein BA723_02645 [Helicobacter sp. CLO-3]